jgi:hypothetical protein
MTVETLHRLLTANDTLGKHVSNSMNPSQARDQMRKMMEDPRAFTEFTRALTDLGRACREIGQTKITSARASSKAA